MSSPGVGTPDARDARTHEREMRVARALAWGPRHILGVMRWSLCLAYGLIEYAWTESKASYGVDMYVPTTWPVFV